MTPMNDGLCHAKKGLLVLRECGRPALSSCESCGVGLCENHQLLTQYGVFCPDCAANDERLSGLDDERLNAARYRRDDLYAGGYYAFFDSSDSGAFTDEDFQTFDTQAGPGEMSPGSDVSAQESDWEAGEESPDADDMDDFMES